MSGCVCLSYFKSKEQRRQPSYFLQLYFIHNEAYCSSVSRVSDIRASGAFKSTATFFSEIKSNFPIKFKGRCSVHVKQYVTIISQSTSLILHVVNDVSVSYTLIAKRSEHYVERLPT